MKVTHVIAYEPDAAQAVAERRIRDLTSGEPVRVVTWVTDVAPAPADPTPTTPEEDAA